MQLCFSGYGNIAPLSDGGKVFCMVFAVFGIPMTAIMLTAIVERLLQLTEVLEKFLCSTCTVRGVPTAYLRFLHLSLIMCGAITLVMIIQKLFYIPYEMVSHLVWPLFTTGHCTIVIFVKLDILISPLVDNL